MERWLVMSNCQTVGLANCLQAQAPDIVITPLDPGQFKARPWRVKLRMGSFDRLLIYPAIRQEVPKARLDRISTHVELPIITFRGYHPDLIYIFNRAKPLSGPISHYHSAIVFACYLQGISASDTLAYFNGHFFERCGYFDVWSGERDRLVAEFEAAGLNIRPYFRDWGRTTAFMYSYNHPRIQPLYDMASALLECQDLPTYRSDLIPHDNLANSAIFAVYPEIGESVGVHGRYEFRSAGNYRTIGLEEYIGRCFALYATLQVSDLEPFHEFRKQVEDIRALL
ncbi:hypothetical protein EWE75_20640 [Sphingomonas populi]|uniref:Polysaccharide biosynthesis enzyme WcbI domain-containing protein n=1 Tax=Sphingomonas populi TaxID=2484750 RepID=A0A4V2DCB5_9SPHN|nr:WcbI family polysaccharide biosynthesis putative acetyltransferase [Sphingomonas populi]RZF60908.1 hypothetical protein EWE75_20640 [Sphingomonas populi]